MPRTLRRKTGGCSTSTELPSVGERTGSYSRDARRISYPAGRPSGGLSRLVEVDALREQQEAKRRQAKPFLQAANRVQRR
jgi:hypothetical protein